MGPYQSTSAPAAFFTILAHAYLRTYSNLEKEVTKGQNLVLRSKADSKEGKERNSHLPLNLVVPTKKLKYASKILQK